MKRGFYKPLVLSLGLIAALFLFFYYGGGFVFSQFEGANEMAERIFEGGIYHQERRGLVTFDLYHDGRMSRERIKEILDRAENYLKELCPIAACSLQPVRIRMVAITGHPSSGATTYSYDMRARRYFRDEYGAIVYTMRMFGRTMEDILAEVLPHELLHVVNSQFVCGVANNFIPRGLDEALATLVETTQGRPNAAILIIANPRPLSRFSLSYLLTFVGDYPENQRENLNLYSSAASLMAYLTIEHGYSKWVQYFHLSAQAGFDRRRSEAVFREVYGVSFAEMEREWKDWVNREIINSPLSRDELVRDLTRKIADRLAAYKNQLKRWYSRYNPPMIAPRPPFFVNIYMRKDDPVGRRLIQELDRRFGGRWRRYVEELKETDDSIKNPLGREVSGYLIVDRNGVFMEINAFYATIDYLERVNSGQRTTRYPGGNFREIRTHRH